MKLDGIEIIFNMTNGGQIETDIHFNEPNDDSYQLFALFLSSLEKEQSLIYSAVIKKLKDILRKDDSLSEAIACIFQHKSIIDKNIDINIMKPSQVFSSKNKL